MATMRRRSKSYPVFKAQGREVIERTTLEAGELFEKREIWRREYDKHTGELIGFRINGFDVERVDADLRHMFTSTAISRTEMEVNVLGTRASHTFRLTEPDRLARIKSGLAPEDEIERAIAKVRVYPHVGAAQGDILRVWPK